MVDHLHDQRIHISEVELELQQARGPTACKVRNKKEEGGREKKTVKETGGGDVDWIGQINEGVFLPLKEPQGGKKFLIKSATVSFSTFRRQ
jgi:hypothetical protein